MTYYLLLLELFEKINLCKYSLLQYYYAFSARQFKIKLFGISSLKCELHQYIMLFI